MTDQVLPVTGLTAGASGLSARLRAVPIAVFAVIFALLLFLRHPGGIMQAEFWGEDGWVWYPDAYRMGLHSLLLPHTGYLQSISRLVALAAQAVPLRWAPTVFAVCALLIQALPPLLLVSRRFDRLWPNLPSRLAFAIVYIALPNNFEEFGNLTNSQWYLAILAFLVVVSAPPRRTAGRVCDLIVLLVAGLSGPFCLMLAPIALWSWLKEMSRDRLARLAVVLATVAIQAAMLLATMRATRPAGGLGISLDNLAHIIAMKLVLGLMLGSHVIGRLAQSPFWAGTAATSVIAAVGLAILVLAFGRGGSLFRRFAVFGGLVTAAALLSPVVTAGKPAWVVLAAPEAGQRYFLIPMLVMAAAFFTLAADRARWIAGGGWVLCLGMLVGMAGDWPYPHMRPTDFARVAAAFEAAPPGTRMAFPLHPSGAGPMVLVKQ